jgi:hypothetical protein
MVVHFVDTLTFASKACAKTYGEIRSVDDFAPSIADLPGATDDERAARAIAATAADPLARWGRMAGDNGVGLRGGTFSVNGDTDVRFRLKDLRWVEDLAVRGKVRWHRDTGDVTAEVKGRVPSGQLARFDLAWNDRASDATVTITGSVGPRPVALVVPAP